MKGQPVWLASASRKNRSTGRALPTTLWSPAQVRAAIDTLRSVIGPAGNPDRERHFRMPATYCIHRAATDEEVAQLPPWFCEQPALDLAGGPLEILWESEEGNPSTRPCHSPVQREIRGNTSPLLFVPADCGACPPCRARRVIDELMDVKRRAFAATDRG